MHPSCIVTYGNNQYSRDNFPFKKFSKDSVYGWIKAISLVNNREIYILADHVLFPYNGDYTNSTSSGSAAHSIKNNLIDHSIYELIERDAFMIFWLNRLCLPNIRINTIPNDLKKRVNNITTLGYDVSIKSIGLDIHPVIFVAVRDSSGVYMTSGIASGSNPFQVLDSALSEVEVALLHVLNLEKKKTSLLVPENVISLIDHESLHQQPSFKAETDFLFREFDIINFSDFVNLFFGKNILIKLENLGFDILEVDASDWEIDILLPEFRYVSRCIVPGLVPLSYGFGNEPLGMDRVYNVPKRMNLKRFDLVEGELNLFPHPFN